MADEQGYIMERDQETHGENAYGQPGETSVGDVFGNDRNEAGDGGNAAGGDGSNEGDITLNVGRGGDAVGGDGGDVMTYEEYHSYREYQDSSGHDEYQDHDQHDQHDQYDEGYQHHDQPTEHVDSDAVF